MLKQSLFKTSPTATSLISYVSLLILTTTLHDARCYTESLSKTYVIKIQMALRQLVWKTTCEGPRNGSRTSITPGGIFSISSKMKTERAQAVRFPCTQCFKSDCVQQQKANGLHKRQFKLNIKASQAVTLRVNLCSQKKFQH